MSPLEIEIILHYHISGVDHDRMTAPAVVDAIRRFMAAGLMQPKTGSQHKRSYELTDGGRMLVDALCSVPFPVQKWVMPERP